MTNKKIIIAAGGTGGHIFPAQALAEELIKKDISFTFICDHRTKKFLQEPLKSSEKIFISAKQFRGNILNKTIASLCLVQSIFFILFTFVFNRPSKIIGFGGYPSFPTLFVGIILMIPIYIHEQNSVLGKVNRCFLPFCKKIFITFPYTDKLKPKYSSKVEIIGNLTRSSIVPKSNKKGSKKELRILIIGGSQGAKSFAEVIPQSLKLIDTSSQKNLSIHLQVRKENIEDVKKLLADFEGSIVVDTFFQNIGELMNESDLIISRAGASTIAEIITMSKPSILIPFPYATDNHQYHNAKYLSDNDSCILIDESRLSPQSLSTEIEKILIDSTALTFMSKNIKKLYIEEPQKKFIDGLCN